MSLIKFYFSTDLKTIDKEEAKKKVIENGGIVREEISTDLWYLVTNDFTCESRNFIKARKLGVTFINETEFLRMLK